MVIDAWILIEPRDIGASILQQSAVVTMNDCNFASISMPALASYIHPRVIFIKPPNFFYRITVLIQCHILL